MKGRHIAVVMCDLTLCVQLIQLSDLVSLTVYFVD